MNKKTENKSMAMLAQYGFERLQTEDPVLFNLLESENSRQNEVLAMVAASSVADPSVLVCEGTATVNVTTEGYPGARFHAGCNIVDEIENLAIDRAKKAFNAQYANVQPHSGSSANGVILFSFMNPGDTLLGLDLDCGGHLTHGSKASVTGRYFNPVSYGLTDQGFIDYDQVRDQAIKHKPKIIISGASAYPRTIDFKRFREIADEVGAYLIADVSHIAGLIVAGAHPSPIDHAHFTTTSTYKQLYGPRGGLILMGHDHDAMTADGKTTLSTKVQRGVFPYFQGTPNLAGITAKARALDHVCRDEFKVLGHRIVDDAKALAQYFSAKGYQVLTGGTDNHIVLMNILTSKSMTGVVAEKALESCNLIVNKNRIFGDQKSAMITSGIRLGSNSLALRGMGPEQMPICAGYMDQVLSAVNVKGDKEYSLNADVQESVITGIKKLCNQFPLPGYGTE